MKLNVLERLLLLGLLPAEGDLTTIRIVRTLREELSFNEEDHAKLNFRTIVVDDKSNLQWDDGVIEDKEFELGAKAQGVIVDALNKLEDAGKVTEQHISLFDKFKE